MIYTKKLKNFYLLGFYYLVFLVIFNKILEKFFYQFFKTGFSFLKVF